MEEPVNERRMLARTSAAEELVVQVEGLLTPGCYISCTRLELLLGAGPKAVNTARAPPTPAFDLAFTSHRPTPVQTAARCVPARLTRRNRAHRTPVPQEPSLTRFWLGQLRRLVIPNGNGPSGPTPGPPEVRGQTHEARTHTHTHYGDAGFCL